MRVSLCELSPNSFAKRTNDEKQNPYKQNNNGKHFQVPKFLNSRVTYNNKKEGRRMKHVRMLIKTKIILPFFVCLLFHTLHMFH